MIKKVAIFLIVLLIAVNVVSATENNDTQALKQNAGSIVTVEFKNSVTGEVYGTLSNTIKEGDSWGLMMAKFNNMIANHKTFKMDGFKYTFTHWNGPNGVVDGTQRFYCTGYDYLVTFYADYDKELLGCLNFVLNDEHGHNGHTMTYTDEADYRFTFKEPVDVEDGYNFLYYENVETGEVYNPGDDLSIPYSEFKGQELTVEVNAVYEKIVENETENETIENDTSEDVIYDDVPINNSTSDDETLFLEVQFPNDESNGTMNDTSNHTSVLEKHKTGIGFIGLVGIVIFAIGLIAADRIYK